MSRVAHYLQEHLVGEVVTSTDARRFFSTDCSVFAAIPSIIVYPRGEADVRKVTRFAWQLAERGRSIPITARGAGTDQSGAAIGTGIVLVFPAHMNRVVEFDGKTGNVIVEPGIMYGKLQQTLETHGRFLPPFPASLEYSTVGGAIANNASGEKTVKYGDTSTYVSSMRAVLANGEVIETKRLTKRELSKKLGLATFEGEIYRSLDTLLDEHRALVEQSVPRVTKSNAGYALADIKRQDGSFDLTPLLVGSQGTLAIVTEATMTTKPYNPETTVIIAAFNDPNEAQKAVHELRAMGEDMPSAIELVDEHLLEAVKKINPNQLKDVIDEPFPPLTLIVEFDGSNERQQKKAVKRASKILGAYATGHKQETEPLKQADVWKIRQASGSILSAVHGHAKAVPVIDDGIVPLERFSEYLDGIYALFERNGLQPAVWGHAGDANFHLQPHLDLSAVGDRQKVFKLMDEYYKLVISLGGSVSAEYNDGRLRGPYLPKQFGQEMYGLFQKVKNIFDPYNTMNPGVKINVTHDDVRPMLRNEYDLAHLHQHLPRS
ncbi:MAG TPA: FAD-binding oxidoreductase [Candidatus Microsaccharimonas sp.]|nr:FAD-binding oxidoreductase [Candidatus Microsaccharimonas sp.]